MDRADLLAFPPTRIVRRMPKRTRKIPPLAKRSPALIAWAGLVMIMRAAVPPTLYVLAGAGVLRLLGY